MTALAYLSRLCRRWGGELVLVPESEFFAMRFSFNGLTRGPDDNHAIDWPNWKVLAVDGRRDVGAIIHEMGHLFLEEGAPKTTEETDWLGWEIALARRARCYRIWSRQNADYEMGDVCGLLGVPWGYLTTTERKRVIADRIAYAKQIGILSEDGEPLCTRKQR